MDKHLSFTVPVVLAIIMAVFIFVIWWPFPPQPRYKARAAACRSNLKQLSMSLKAYMQDYNEKMPPAAIWSSVLNPYVKDADIFICPEVRPSCGYSFYDKLDRINKKSISDPVHTPLLFDSTAGWNSALPITLGCSPTPGRI